MLSAVPVPHPLAVMWTGVASADIGQQEWVAYSNKHFDGPASVVESSGVTRTGSPFQATGCPYIHQSVTNCHADQDISIKMVVFTSEF